MGQETTTGGASGGTYKELDIDTAGNTQPDMDKPGGGGGEPPKEWPSMAEQMYLSQQVADRRAAWITFAAAAVPVIEICEITGPRTSLGISVTAETASKHADAMLAELDTRDFSGGR